MEGRVLGQDQQYIIIVGCGCMGSVMANRLSSEGHSVVVIDRDPAAFGRLSTAFSGFRMEGDAAESALLQQAKADKADAVISATGDDNVNLMVAQIARRVFSVRNVLARVNDPEREALFRLSGIRTATPTTLAAEALHQALHEQAEEEQ
jgi:trk system potassium uptake protein TrkA